MACDTSFQSSQKVFKMKVTFFSCTLLRLIDLSSMSSALLILVLQYIKSTGKKIDTIICEVPKSVAKVNMMIYFSIPMAY